MKKKHVGLKKMGNEPLVMKFDSMSQASIWLGRSRNYITHMIRKGSTILCDEDGEHWKFMESE